MGRGNETKEETLKKLFVGGLSRETTDDQFRDYFTQFGNVTDHIVIKDGGGISKGFGFVTFDSEEGAENAIRSKSDGHIINNKSVEVKRAIPRDAEPDQREKNTKMFLGGLNRNTTEDTIKRYFEQNFDCVVDSVDLIYEKRDQLQPGQEPKPRGFAFVTINDYDKVDHLCVIRMHEIDGKEVEVKKAVSKTGGGGGGGRRGGRDGGGGRNYNQGGGYNQGGYNQGGGGGYNQGGYNQGGYNQGGGYNNQGGGGGYNQGGYNQGGYNQGGGYNNQSGGGGGYNQGGYNQQQGGYGGYGDNSGYNQGGAGGYDQGGYNQQQGSYGGGYQNNNFSGPDKGARGGANKPSGRGGYKPY